jgi:carboxypeptidase C (cathepsin A)
MYINDLDSSSSSEADIIYNTCDDDPKIVDFLNEKETQNKLNVNKIWEKCSELNYSISESIEFYQKYLPTIKDRVKVWIMSGDTDIILSTLGTKRWIYSLKSEIDKDWNPIYDEENQIRGFKISYKNGLTFITAKGAGHMLPEDEPKTAEIILNLFINETLN